MKPHKHAEIIKLWADGAVIEFRVHDADSWATVNEPSWVVHYQYRIKPEPKPDEVRYGVARVGGVDFLGPYNNNISNNIRLTFDGETGQLKAAEVLK